MARTSWPSLRWYSFISSLRVFSSSQNEIRSKSRGSSWGDLRPRFASSKKDLIKRAKNEELDSVLTREKKYKVALKVKDVLAKEKAHVMSLNDLGKMRKKLGFPRTKRFASLAAKYPAVFNIIKDNYHTLWMEFTDEVEDLVEEEEEFRKLVHEPWIVGTLRKLLMLSADRRLAVDKINHLKHEFGLPDDFRTNLVYNYPQFFRVVDDSGKSGAILELTEWDPSLAITARERKMKEECCEFDELIGENTGYGFRLSNPKGYTPRKKQRELLSRFQTLPFPSPYEDPSHLAPNSLELEKRTVALVHEFLSLTLHKRAVANHMLHFRREFRLPQRMLALLLRHQGIFYVSFKGDIHTVFLKEAYEGRNLKERNPVLEFNSRLIQLLMVKKADAVAGADEATNEGRLSGNEGMDDDMQDNSEADVGEDEFDGDDFTDEDDIDHDEGSVDFDDGSDGDAYDEFSSHDTIGKL